MATIHRDDVTGEEYRSDNHLYEYGIMIGGMYYDTFESVSPGDVESMDHLEAVVEELHDMVDEWAENEREHIQSE